MSRVRRRSVAALVVGAVLVAAPAAAHDFTGHEEDERTLACPQPGEEVPRNQEPPGPEECGPHDETYRGTVWDNDVTCAQGGTDVAGVQVYTVAVGWPHNEYSAGVCNDGRSAAPVQGRVVAQGWQLEEYSVYADGDRDNAPAVAQGWARVDGSTSGASLRCGDEDGRRDATHAQAGVDTADDCG